MHVDSKCGHVSIVLFKHNMEFGLRAVWAKYIFLVWLSMYWAYQNFRCCDTCALEMSLGIHKRLEFVAYCIIGKPFIHV